MRKLLMFVLCISKLTFAQNDKETAVKLAFETKQFEKTRQLANELLANNSQNIVAHTYLGHIAGNNKDWDSAINHYKLLTTIKTNNADFHYWYGGVLGMKALENKLSALGLVKKMKKAFHKAAVLDNKHIDARWALLETYLQLPGIIGGSYKKAELYAEELASISEVEGHLAKAYIANYKKQYELEKKYQKLALMSCNLISESYKRNTIHYQLAKAAINNNQGIDLALKHLDWFIKKHKRSDSVAKEWAYFYCAKAYRLKKDKKKALAYLNKAKKNKEVAKYSKKEEGIILAL
ncbi:hypothetical protein ABN763_09820 [Spongiivirga sp. MCCC 1A20706]|uniref:tetratricopeptide repeat protein n=1 Tax=Spongiivirga sp. MCCC 1A20706 TaxID=3160963 RepID=UPI003977C50C